MFIQIKAREIIKEENIFSRVELRSSLSKSLSDCYTEKED